LALKADDHLTNGINSVDLEDALAVGQNAAAQMSDT
jgi:hypothetical protein